ncbi:uncharacterized protein V1510DRAFT_364801 [Dipodascopsis tothii]|uniref:uncharacterized protein n=1 Tax=Dipodascopsis tothii TaxID=44089 RepID=UPI0034CF60C8
MDDLLDLSFSSDPIAPAKGVSKSAGPGPKLGVGSSGRPMTASTSPSTAAQPASSSMFRSGSGQQTSASPPTKPSEDSFASLVSFSTQKSQAAARMSLKEHEQAKKHAPAPPAGQGADWASNISFESLNLGSARPSPAAASPAFASPPSISPALSPPIMDTSLSGSSNTGLDDLDIFSEYRPSPPVKSTPSPMAAPRGQPPANLSLLEGDDIVDVSAPARPPRPTRPSASPASSISPVSPASPPEMPARPRRSRQEADPRDGPIAELVEMGFTADVARRALAETETGLDVEQAIEILLAEAQQKMAQRQRSRREPVSRSSSGASRFSDSGAPADDSWQEMPSAAGAPRRQALFATLSQQPSSQELGKIASELSSEIKTRAGSLWSQGKSRLAKALDDYNSQSASPDGDDNPRWMRNQQRYQNPLADGMVDPTAEMQLRRERPPPRKSPMPFGDDEPIRVPQWRRRSKPAEEPLPPRPERPRTSTPSAPQASRPARPARPPSPRPPKPSRPPIEIPAAAAGQIAAVRAAGLDAFKAGDFGRANELFSEVLALVPAQHVLRTVFLSNRALCLLRLGDAKASLVDSDEGLAIVGPRNGADEDAEPGKPLAEIWAKLKQRRAEALEQLERYVDARDAWNDLVRSGKGGKPAADGKRRCDAVVNPAKAKPAPKPAPKPAATLLAEDDMGAARRAALDKLKATHQEAEDLEAAKFALHDKVERKILLWRNGKEDNLRGLLASMDTVLWPETGWTKVSLADLVVPKRVKIVYMKAVARTHPDKIAQDATVEQKMIAQAVFVTINKAWDEFKKTNDIQ